MNVTHELHDVDVLLEDPAQVLDSLFLNPVALQVQPLYTGVALNKGTEVTVV